VSIFQAIGYVTFDGLSKATFNLTAPTNQGIGSTVTWSGTYSVQASCVATLTIGSGGNANFKLALYASGTDFLMTGSDSVYAYSGSENIQLANCSTSLLVRCLFGHWSGILRHHIHEYGRWRS
jgi:hypothetical protein